MKFDQLNTFSMAPRNTKQNMFFSPFYLFRSIYHLQRLNRWWTSACFLIFRSIFQSKNAIADMGYRCDAIMSLVHHSILYNFRVAQPKKKECNFFLRWIVSNSLKPIPTDDIWHLNCAFYLYHSTAVQVSIFIDRFSHSWNHVKVQTEFVKYI